MIKQAKKKKIIVLKKKKKQTKEKNPQNYCLLQFHSEPTQFCWEFLPKCVKIKHMT